MFDPSWSDQFQLYVIPSGQHELVDEQVLTSSSTQASDSELRMKLLGRVFLSLCRSDMT